MHDLIKIAVDAMGGDGSPKKIIDGIIHNHKKNKENFFRIFGKKNIFENDLNSKIDKKFYEVICAKGFEKNALRLLKSKKNLRIIDSSKIIKN